MKLYFIAGEASGDLHGSNLIRSVLKENPEASIRGVGGEKMQAAGADIWRDYSETAVMGFTAVLTHLGKILRNMRECRRDILVWKPDALVLIDYPGFNMKMARFAHNKGIKVFYYIAPKVWAWKEWRVRQIRKYVDRLFVIFPFEVPYFAKRGVEADYEGNPLMDSVGSYNSMKEPKSDFLTRHGLDDKPIIALLPGSRKMEISYLMPRFAQYEELLEKARPGEYRLVLAQAPEVDESFLKSFLGAESRMKIVDGDTYGVLKNASCAVVASGTATLEAALIGTPQTAVYGGGALTFGIVKKIVKIKLYTLPNIIMGREIFRELFQTDCTPENILSETLRLLEDPDRYSRMKRDYDSLRKTLGNPGVSDRIAHIIIGILNS